METKLTKEKESKLRSEYFKSKEELNEIRSDSTILKWKVLSRAYKIGKELWGESFTVARLAEDMGLPYTTTKRCLALDRANEKNWEAVRQKKISAFALAMICMTKKRVFQDEIVQEVIRGKLSTYDIKHYKPKDLSVVEQWEESQAKRREGMRKEKTFTSLNNWIDRGQVLLLTPITSVTKERKKI